LPSRITPVTVPPTVSDRSSGVTTSGAMVTIPVPAVLVPLSTASTLATSVKTSKKAYRPPVSVEVDRVSVGVRSVTGMPGATAPVVRRTTPLTPPVAATRMS
jgi:hypothetical protein